MTSAITGKGERRRQQLVDAAVELLREVGRDGVRHRAVAERAGVPLASTTYYFESLDDLLACAIEASARAENAAIRDRVDAVSRRRRGAESTVEMLVDVLVAPASGADDGEREPLVLRLERLAECGRTPRVRAVQAEICAQNRELLADALRRSGRTVTPGGLRHLVEMANGAVLMSMVDERSHPRACVRAVLLPVIDLFAPLH